MDSEVKVCVSCSTELGDDAHTTDSDDFVCGDCITICERCDLLGTVDDERQSINGGNSYWCNNCADNYANFCNSCNEYHTGDNYYAEDRNGSYCEYCISDACYCEGCYEYYFDGCDCQEREADIHDYSYRPDPIFHSTKDNERLYFGMEIEVESPDEDYGVRKDASSYASTKLESANLAYLKSDGSLSCGFEIVTHPMSHDYFKNEAHEFWATIGVLRNDWHMRSWSAGTAGLHIHISRSGFNGGSHMHRFLQLVYENEDFYSRIAGRKSDRWATFSDVIKGVSDNRTVRSYKNKVNPHGSTERYSAINTQNRHTLEMRIFRSTLNPDTIKSMLDLAHASVEYTRRLTVPEVIDGALRFNKLIQYIHENKDTYQHLLSRMDRLFVASKDSE